MKKVNVIIVALAVVALVSGSAQSVITGSAHDFSVSGASWSGGEICKACHTPHNAYPYAGQGPGITEGPAPLWNHNNTSSSFALYSSPTGTFNGTSTQTQPAGVSRACLSCHDGTVGLEAFGGAVSTTHLMTNVNGDLLGTGLANDHPVSFTYDAALVTADGGGLKATSSAALGGTIATRMLFNDRMECGSCHDVHNTPGFPKMLLMSNAASALCLTCHIK